MQSVLLEVGSKGISESNSFLRALWANLRSRFKPCVWAYSPHKRSISHVKNSQYYHIAQLSLGDDANPMVGFTYTKKGNIDKIEFTFLKVIDNADQYHNIFAECVDNAKKDMFNPRPALAGITLRGPSDVKISPYKRESFIIKNPNSNGSFNVYFNVKEYDDYDFQDQRYEASCDLLFILSFIMNTAFSIDNHVSLEPSEATEIPEKTNILEPDDDWIENCPRRDDYLIFCESDLNALDAFMNNREVHHYQKFMRGWTHFYEALSLGPLFQGRNDMCIVLAVSALEVVADIHFDKKPEVCKECNGQIFSIRQKVLSFAEEFGDQALRTILDSYYKMRSKYLHTGEVSFFQNPSPFSFGIFVPKFQSDGTMKFRGDSTIAGTNVLELTSYVLRRHFRSLATKF